MAMGSSFMRNRIINGAMVIDQRNAGAAVTAANYTVDRWIFDCSVSSKFSVQQNAGSVTPPTGFSNYLGATSLSAYSLAAGDYFVIDQKIEGYNVSDLAFGTASAKPITISFFVRSSLTGSFGGSITNGAANRAYPFSYSIPVANTWTAVSVTIPGDTTGTWQTGNGTGIWLRFSLGVGSTYSGTANTWQNGVVVQPTGSTSVVGTNGATFYITGVQLEVGSVATPFEREIYSQTLAKCQRYFSLTPIVNTGIANGTTNMDFMACYPVQMRASATITAKSLITVTNSIASDFSQSSATIGSVITSGAASAYIRFNNFSGLTSGAIYNARTADQYVNTSAEL
jgi:hypothetical protein